MKIFLYIIRGISSGRTMWGLPITLSNCDSDQRFGPLLAGFLKGWGGELY